MEKKPKIQKKSDELKARLIKLGCFYEFCENLKKQQNISYQEYADNEDRKYYQFSAIILTSLRWAETPQGYIFWSNIHKKINKV